MLTFWPDLDCTIIWAALSAKYFVNFSKSFLSCMLSCVDIVCDLDNDRPHRNSLDARERRTRRNTITEQHRIVGSRDRVCHTRTLQSLRIALCVSLDPHWVHFELFTWTFKIVSKTDLTRDTLPRKNPRQTQHRRHVSSRCTRECVAGGDPCLSLFENSNICTVYNY